MFSIEIIKEACFKIDKKIIDKILNIFSNIITKKQNWILNIVFLDDDSIKILNNKYRWKDNTTDVLSFHYFDDFSLLWKDEIVGEIIMSESKISSQALEYRHSEELEFYKLLIHSILHILWYDHEKDEDYIIMQELENKIWETIFWK